VLTLCSIALLGLAFGISSHIFGTAKFGFLCPFRECGGHG
jgi:hypothetical protein